MRIFHKLFGLAVLGLSLLAAGESIAQTTVTHRYDFEPLSGYVTEPGWTHITYNTGFTPTSAGFDLAESSIYAPGTDRGSSIQPPTSVTRDLLIGAVGGTFPNDPNIVFRDIVPAHSTNVTFTIYRSDPGDFYTPDFDTYVRYNGGPLVFVDGGLPIGGTYFPPILGNLALTPTTTDGTLDFYFWGGNAIIRLNGIEAIYTIPEPAAGLLLALGGLVILARRKR